MRGKAGDGSESLDPVWVLFACALPELGVAFLVSSHPGQTALSLSSYLPYDVEAASSQG